MSLENLPEKFFHYVQEHLLPQEQVLAWLWRPDITLDSALVSQWPFYEATQVNHLVLLTNRALMLIWDRVAGDGGEDEGYGVVWRYIPLMHITGVTVQEDSSGVPYLNVTLCDQLTLERMFTANQRIELEELVQKIQAACTSWK